MAIHSPKNLYPGINPHLNSGLQQTGGGWQGFHTKHLNDLTDTLESLLQGTKYYVDNETSLQVGEESIKPDVLIAKRDLAQPPITTLPSISPVLTLAIAETLNLEEDEDAPISIVIYTVDNGIAVTRIELLSPANKLPSQDYYDYFVKRKATLEQGLRLIEIDFLHQRRPILSQIPSYRHRESNAYPYHIMVSDPRPDIHQGQTQVFSFEVMDKLPVITIPLGGSDTISVDFNDVYQRTFASRRLFWEIKTDYSQLPANFASYTPEDQERIRQQMKSIAEQYSKQD